MILRTAYFCCGAAEVGPFPEDYEGGIVATSPSFRSNPGIKRAREQFRLLPALLNNTDLSYFFATTNQRQITSASVLEELGFTRRSFVNDNTGNKVLFHFCKRSKSKRFVLSKAFLDTLPPCILY